MLCHDGLLRDILEERTKHDPTTNRKRQHVTSDETEAEDEVG